jgi:hypothetical protein
MKLKPFEAAVFSAKLLLLVSASPAMTHNEAVRKPIARLRSKIDQAVLMLCVGQNPVCDTSLEQYLSTIQEMLLKLVQPLGFGYLLGDDGYERPTPDSRRAARTLVAELTKLERHVPEQSDQCKAVLLREATLASVHPQRSSLGKAFGSVVRNAEWSTVLVALDKNPNFAALGGLNTQGETSAHQARKYARQQALLDDKHGSAQGKANLLASIAQFVTESTEPVPEKLSVADVAVTTVHLDHVKLLKLPRVRALSQGFTDVSPRIVDLLAAASTPTEVPAKGSPQSIAEKKLDAFYAGLDQREAAIQRVRDTERDAAAREQHDRAVAALRDLGPLAQVLKDNPSLLQQV